MQSEREKAKRANRWANGGCAFLAIWGLGWWMGPDPPDHRVYETYEDAAETYLTALRDGHTEYVQAMAKNTTAFDSGNPYWLDPPYSADWAFEVQSWQEGYAYIHVPYLMTSGDEEAEGAFMFSKNRDDTILNPVAEAALGDMPVDYLDLSGVKSETTTFPPGVYDVYADESEFFDVETERELLVARNRDSPDRPNMPIPKRLENSYELTDYGAETIAAEVTAWLGACATEGARSLPECQRDGWQNEYMPRNFSERRDGVDVVEQVRWEMLEVPNIEVTQGNQFLEVSANGDAVALLDVTFESGETVSMECELDLTEMGIRIPDVDVVKPVASLEMFLCL